MKLIYINKFFTKSQGLFQFYTMQEKNSKKKYRVDFFASYIFSLDILWYLFLPYSLFIFFTSSDNYSYLFLAFSLILSLLFL